MRRPTLSVPGPLDATIEASVGSRLACPPSEITVLAWLVPGGALLVAAPGRGSA
jgi:hypothetical protein